MKGKILIIDDEKDLLVTLKKYLTLRDYSVTTRDNGKDGVEEVKRNKYDLLLVDIRMPSMNGVDVIKNIEKIDDKARFLIITGYSITGEVTDLIESSKRVHGYIFKPFRLEHLEEKIEGILKLKGRTG